MTLLCVATAFLLHVPIGSAAESDKAEDPPQLLANMPAGLYRTDNNHTHLYFTYSHVGFSRSHGRFDRCSGELHFDPKNPESSAVTFTIDPEGSLIGDLTIWGLGNVPLVGDDIALEFDVEFTKVV